MEILGKTAATSKLQCFHDNSGAFQFHYNSKKNQKYILRPISL